MVASKFFSLITITVLEKKIFKKVGGLAPGAD